MKYNYFMPIYKRFVINKNSNEHSKKIVDDFLTLVETPTTLMLIDVARIAVASSSATQIIYNSIYLFYQSNFIIQNLKKVILIGRNACKIALTTNYFHQKLFNNGSRTRCLVHSGIVGFLAIRLCLKINGNINSHQKSLLSKDVLCIINRSNNEIKACQHVKWSIKEFNLLFNIGISIYKTPSSPFNDLTEEESIERFVMINTIENQNAFIERCNKRHHLYQYRIIGPRKEYNNIDPNLWIINNKINIQIIDEWGSIFIAGILKILGIKMIKFNDEKNGDLKRGLYIIEIFQFIADHMLWIFHSDYFTQIMNLTKLRKVIIERCIYLANEGLEHAAYFLGLLYPEMMTSKIYLNVRPTYIYNSSELWIYHNKDPIFGPMKVAFRKLMPNGENRCII
jgi:hypothetical protein